MSPKAVQSLFSAARTSALPRGFGSAVLRLPQLRREMRRSLDEARAFFADAQVFTRFAQQIEQLQRTKFQLFFYRELRTVSKYWLIVHVVLSVFMLVLLTLHVGVSIYIGYRWLWSG